MEFLITTIVAVILLVGVVSSCPKACDCVEGVVSCNNKTLTSIPADFPSNTLVL
jgi:hypothetical protein